MSQKVFHSPYHNTTYYDVYYLILNPYFKSLKFNTYLTHLNCVAVKVEENPPPLPGRRTHFGFPRFNLDPRSIKLPRKAIQPPSGNFKQTGGVW